MIQSPECNIINDTDCEVILRFVLFQVVEYRNNLCRSCIMRTQTITATNDHWFVLYIIICTLYIQIQWFTFSSRFLCTVEYCNTLNRSRNRCQQMFYREWTIQVNTDHTYFFAISVQVINSLASCLRSRTHQDDHAVGVFSSIVREQVIFTTCAFTYFAKIFLYNFRNLVIIFVGCLTVCEECLRILSSTTCYRTLWCQSAVAETFNVCLVN